MGILDGNPYSLESVHHELLVVDHVLPETGHVGVTRDSKVGL